MNKGLDELVLWQKARKYRQVIWRFSQHLPDEENFRLKDQLIRASRSVSANIAEGNGRYYFKENIQFCRRARGSLTETYEHLICAFDCRYLDQDQLENILTIHRNLLKILNGYIRYLKSFEDV
ncbi:MAG: four helix bundle protein [Saprospiraceae bacterium]|nr:four helix bundle protein [Saprospiraceae bacterium]